MSRPAWNFVDTAGYLGADPELRTTPAGKSVTNISIACPLFIQKEIQTTWMRAALFGHNAEFCCKYGKKGDFVCVKGILINKKYIHQGVEKESLEILGQEFYLLKKKETKEEDQEI